MREISISWNEIILVRSYLFEAAVMSFGNSAERGCLYIS